MTLLSLSFGWIYRRVESERRAAEAIAAARGTVVYDWQVRPPDSKSKLQLEPSGPQWLRERLGTHWFDSIVEVQLNDHVRSSENRFSVVGPHLAKLRSLRSLRLDGGELTADDFRLLGQLWKIEELHLRPKAEIRPENAAAIARMTTLRVLRLDRTQISAPALQELTKLSHLEELTVDSSSFDPSTGERLRELQLDDEAAQAIASFPRLRQLMLFATQITDDGMATLIGLSRLEVLVISSPCITSASFDHVVELQRLEHLGTWAWKIDDTDLGKLSQLPNLTSLDLQTELTDASVPHLLKLDQLKWLTLRGDGITDGCVPQFYGRTNLERLNLNLTSINKNGAAAKALKQHLQNCTISLPPTAAEEATRRAFQEYKWGGRKGAVRILGQEQSEGVAHSVEHE